MTRSVRVAIIGWSVGFLVAGLFGLTQSGNHALASALFIPAGIGMVVLGVLVVVGVIRDRRWIDLDDVDGPEGIPALRDPAPPRQEVSAQADAASAAAAVAMARIAELEARLAVEQQQLDEVVHALAETEGPGASDVAEVDTPEVDADAAAMEPALRQQVLETLVELVGEKDVVDEFESLTAKGQ